jgi:uncharacterized membrane protein YfcA
VVGAITNRFPSGTAAFKWRAAVDPAVVATPGPGLALALGAVVLAAGALNGVAGFGFALVGTTALAAVLEPAVAVVVMIPPILAVNLALVRELSEAGLRDCTARFGPLLGAALVGAVVGMVVVERLPGDALALALGLVALAFVATSQRLVGPPSFPERGGDHGGRGRAESPAAMVGIGVVSGLVFGATNVGVQLIAYLQSRDLSHATFVGVVALVFLGLNAVRIGVAGALGLYPDAGLALASLGAAVPAVAGVAVGRRLRDRVGERGRRAVVLGLLTVVGLRLVAGGLGLA